MTSSDRYPRTRRTAAFERRVAVSLHSLTSAAAPLLVACSGGPDSIATLIAVVRSHAGPVTVGWFDHAMRASAEVEREGLVVRGVAGDLGVPMLEARARTTPRGEAAARTARYRWLARAATKVGADACVTGHTRDDQAETVLLRLVRGAGARGAAGMAPGASWPVPVPPQPVLRLLRPLLDISRADVESYLHALGVEAVRDPSNESLEYARNRVRHHVLPALAEVNAKASAHLAAFAARQRDDDAVLTEWAVHWLDEHAKTAAGTVVLPRKALVALAPAVGRRVLVLAGSQLGIALGEAHLEALGRLVADGSGAQVSLPGAIAAHRGTVLEMRRNA